MEVILVLGLAGMICLQFLYTFGLPLMGFDSRAHWALKSKILHYEDTFYSESFYDSERIHPQVRHPLLLPIIQMVVTRVLGDYDDRLMKLPFFLLYLSLIVFFYCELRRYYSRLTALFFVLFLVTLPLLSTPTDGGITSGYVDAPMAFYFLCTMIFLVRWLQQGNFIPMAFAALFAIFVMYLKDDGIGCVASAIGALLLSLLVLKTSSWKKRILSLILFIVVIFLFLFPGKIYSYSLSVGKGEYFESILKPGSIMKNIGRLSKILSSYELEMLLNLPHWGILWIILLFSIVYNVKRFRVQEVLFVGLTLLFYLCVLTVVFIVLPWDLSQFFAGSLGRLILQMSPVAVYFIALLWKERMSEAGEALNISE
jgi:4-amino-4-deoxy-L-arabinose transferase-like glycosyltransferase